jgi:hypothetical protein
MDDFNVSLKVTLDWYKKARKAGKKDKISLLVTEKGNPTIEDDIFNTGHFFTKNKELFETIMNTISSFILQGPSSLTAIPEWRALRYNILANRNYRSATLEEKFISEAYRLYQDGKDLSERSWKEHYIPLYYALYYLQSQGNYGFYNHLRVLKDANLLTDLAITRGLQLYLGKFLIFLKEKENILLPDNLNLDNLVKNQDLRDQYIDTLTGGRKAIWTTLNFLCSTLYKANPELLKSYYETWEQDKDLQSAIEHAHNKLLTKIERKNKLITSAWQQTVKEAQKTAKVKKIVHSWKQKASQSAQKRRVAQNATNPIDEQKPPRKTDPST